MTTANDEAPRCANSRGPLGNNGSSGGNCASLQPILHRSASPVHRPFHTDGVGLASCVALMLGGSRTLRRDIKRDTRRRAAQGDQDAAQALAFVVDLRRREAAGDERAARMIASIVSGK